VFHPVACALRRGKDDAKSAAGEALPKIKSALSKAACHAAYGLSFAAAFQWAFLKNACPDILKTASRDGASNGAGAGERWAGRWNAPNSQAPTETAAPMPNAPSPCA
jgi:hypothetical protein